MTKEIHQQQSQPFHSYIVGLALLLGWLLACKLFVTAGFPSQGDDHWVHRLYSFIYKQLVFWKLFTLIAFIFGIRAYIYAEKGSAERFFYIRSFIWVVLAACLSFINMLSLSVIPLIIFGVLLFRLRKKGTANPYKWIGVLLILLMLVVWFSGLPDFHTYCFSGFMHTNAASKWSNLMIQIKVPSNHIAWLFGFLVMIIGYAVGNAKWLLEYHFHYAELRRLFFISMGLIAIWGSFNYFHFYHFLINFRIGTLFYLLDALSVQLLTIFVYFFILMYLENFRIGKTFLKILAQSGKLWLFNVFMLFCFILVGNQWKLEFGDGLSMALGLIGFFAASLISAFLEPILPQKLKV